MEIFVFCLLCYVIVRAVYGRKNITVECECLRSMCTKTRRGRAKDVRMVNECEINCLKD